MKSIPFPPWLVTSFVTSLLSLRHVTGLLPSIPTDGSKTRSLSSVVLAKQKKIALSWSLLRARGDDEEDANTVGLALAGGGTRAASTCVGVLRGFQQKTVKTKDGVEIPAMNAFKYTSGISGGSLPVAQYSFSQVPTDELLETERSIDPEKITNDLLEHLPQTSLGVTYTTEPWKIPLISDRSFIRRRIARFHSYWSGLVFNSYFRSLKVPRNKLFAASEADVEEIVKNDPKLKKEDFIYPRPDTTATPLLLFSMKGRWLDFGWFMDQYAKASEEAWKEYKTEEMEGKKPNMTQKMLESLKDHYGCAPVPYTATPNAVRARYEGTIKLKKSGEDIKFPLEDVRPHNWGQRTRFSIEAATTMSTNFLGIALNLLSNVRKVDIDGDKSSKRFADGGLSDLCGVLALMTLKTRNIVCVFNFNQNPPRSDFATTYGEFYDAAPVTEKSDPRFEESFKKWVEMLDPSVTCYFGYFGADRRDSALLNHVFDDPNLDRLKELMLKYNSLYLAGQPLIATLQNLKVLDNPFWGTGPGLCDLTFIYLNMPKEFSSKVPIEVVTPPEGMEKVDEHGNFNNEEFKQIPELPWNPPFEGTSYSKRQVNMVSYLTSWMIDRGWGPVKGHDGTVKFGGFERILAGRDRKKLTLKKKEVCSISAKSNQS